MSEGSLVSVLQPGTLVADRYLITRQLGVGGMGAVVLATDRALDNEYCALKILYPHLVSDQVAFARFRNEVLVARKLSHPNIVRIYDFGSAGNGYYYISMEYVEGMNLGERIHTAPHRQLEFEEKIKILYEVTLGVGFAHSRGVIHRDLKPDNILVSDADRVLITDFGLARTLGIEKGFTDTGEAVGTPYYMAPEQLRGERVDERCDIYAFGILAYELAVGQRPFFDESYYQLALMHQQQELPKFATKESKIPKWFEEMVHTAGAKNREERFSSMDEISEILGYHLADDFSAVRRVSAVSTFYQDRKWKGQKSGRPSALTYVLSGLLACCMLALVIAWVRTDSRARQQVFGLVKKAEESTGNEFPVIENAIGTQEVDASPVGLFAAVNSADVDKVELVLAAGVDVNARNEAGDTALKQAVLTGSAQLVSVLLEKQADANLADAEGKTALIHAITTDAKSISKRLLDLNLNFNARDNSARTALMYAAQKGDVGIVQRLLEKGAYINYQDQGGKTALIYSVMGSHVAAARALLDHRKPRVAVNAQDASGSTALIYATRRDSTALMQALLSAGADVMVTNTEGKSARDFVSESNRALLFGVSATKKSGDSVLYVNRGVPENRQRSRNPKVEKGLEEPVRSTAPQKTRLRLVGKVRGTWKRSKSLTLEDIRATIRNSGSAIADDIEISARIPGGKVVTLKGPRSLAPYKRAEYKASPMEKIGISGDIKLNIKCSNCWR